MVKFGPSGNGRKFYDSGFKESQQAPAWLHSMGLTAYEYSFTRGNFISEEKARAIREQAEQNDIQISVHSPYYINFCNPTDIAVENNFKYLLNSLRGVRMLGGKYAVVHMGSIMKMDRAEAFGILEKSFKDFLHDVGAGCSGYGCFFILAKPSFVNICLASFNC